MKNYAEFHIVAVQAALRAGNLIKKGFNTSYLIDKKEGKQNLVTEYDKKAEELIFSHITKHYPDHALLGEESGLHEATDEILWIIDPLDGTVNFAHGIPAFSISIATAVEGDVVSGVIYQPMTQELFTVEKEKGAFLNGTPLQVSKNSSLDASLLATGFPYNIDENPLNCIGQVAHFLSMGVPIRRIGSAALDLAYVAAGRFDAYWEASLNPWDCAAGVLMVEEAGGTVSQCNGAPRSFLSSDSILSSNTLIHNMMKTHLDKAQ